MEGDDGEEELNQNLFKMKNRFREAEKSRRRLPINVCALMSSRESDTKTGLGQ